MNPIPVGVLLLPVGDGLLTIRRAIPPAVGQLALPGGFVNAGESWQQAAARECFEEVGIHINASDVEDFVARSAPERPVILIFGIVRRTPFASEEDLPAFTPSDETSERVIIRKPEPLAFPLHEEAVRLYFAQRGST